MLWLGCLPGAEKNVFRTLFQVATANLAWASVAIHQVQVCLGRGKGLPECFKCSTGSGVELHKETKALVLNIRSLVSSKIFYLFTCLPTPFLFIAIDAVSSMQALWFSFPPKAQEQLPPGHQCWYFYGPFLKLNRSLH